MAKSTIKRLYCSKPNSYFNKEFGAYLAGLFEGDGHICVPNPQKVYVKEYKPYVGITFNIKDLPLAKKILYMICRGEKGGHIRIKQAENACVLILTAPRFT